MTLYIITANYYYQNGSLNDDQISGLNSAVAAYNNGGNSRVVKVNGEKVHVQYNLSAQGVDDVDAAVQRDFIHVTGIVDGEERVTDIIRYGNSVGIDNTSASAHGGGNFQGISLNTNNISQRLLAGGSMGDIIKGTFIHEIGHNLGLDHQHNTRIMYMNQQDDYTSMINPQQNNRTTFTYPSVDNRGVGIMINSVNAPRVITPEGVRLGVIRTRP